MMVGGYFVCPRLYVFIAVRISEFVKNILNILCINYLTAVNPNDIYIYLDVADSVQS